MIIRCGFIEFINKVILLESFANVQVQHLTKLDAKVQTRGLDLLLQMMKIKLSDVKFASQI